MINQERLWNKLMQLARIGKQAEGGITRLPFTKEDLQAKNLVKEWMEEAGLQVREDAVGNLVGRKEGTEPSFPAIIIGSHLDTVFNGGMFDGTLGVLAGIEILQTMKENQIQTKHPIEVYAFRDEEGCRFNFSLLGSRGVAGNLKPSDLDFKDKNGITIREAMKNCHLNPEDFSQAARRPEEVKAYLELHIEQGKVLEYSNLSLGVVTGIASSLRLLLTVTGKADHAGATPMNLRADALAGAAQIISMVEQEAKESQSAVATVGRIQAYPGGINIIPGKVEFTIDLRDLSPEVSARLEKNILEKAREICKQRGLSLEVELMQRVPPAPCSEEIIATILESCDKLGVKTMKLPSGAGHDAMQMINICPIGMIFVRSKNGISHHPAEWSSPEDCALGAQVLMETLLKLDQK
ncbi:MAG TPA: Zn-dependent hydrolase [Peptococcaceae bacterium]|nr:Zn-dependent hydrolase [Peptococcaceae bacterium]